MGAHIYSEKPIAKSLAEADRMLAAADAKGVKIAIAHQNRVSPYHVHARKLLHEGAIGRLRLIRGYGKMDARGGGQDTMVLGTHIFDQMRFMTNADPEWCQARVTQDGREAAAADVQEGAGEIGLIAGNGLWAAYGFPNGVVATYESYAGTNFADDEGSPAFGFDLCGSEGILSLRVRTLHRYPRPYSGPLVDESGDARWEQVEVDPLPPPPGSHGGRRWPAHGQPLHRARSTQCHRRGSQAVEQRSRWPLVAGDDPRGLRRPPHGRASTPATHRPRPPPHPLVVGLR